MPDWLFVVAGLILLGSGGELLVRGASCLARAFGISPLVIGLTVVSLGTSAPELAVCVQAALGGAGDLALGNVVGSNIFNVLFILGASALLVPLAVSRRLVRVEVPVMIGISVLAVLLSLDGRVSVPDGLLLSGSAVAYLLWMVRASRSEPIGELAGELAAPAASRGGIHRHTLVVVAGLGLLVVGGRLLVAGAVAIAEALGVSDVVIGLTIVAAGTSLPEVAASVIATLRGQRDIAIGNVIGSNIMNLTLILGTTAAVGGPLQVAPAVLTFDMVVMLAVALACLPIFFTGYRIARWEGAVFFAYYIAYTTYLILDATAHGLLPAFRDAMIYFAIPLTALTLGVLAGRGLDRRSGARRAELPGG